MTQRQSESSAMGTKERREREREEKKQLFIDAAVDLIAHQGFENVTMDEIAQKAEYSKGTLYLYFEDKATLLSEIKKQAMKRISTMYSRVLRQDLSGLELILSMSEGFIDFLDENSVYAQSLILPETLHQNDCEIRESNNALQNLLTHAIKIGMQDGSIPKSINARITTLKIGLFLYGLMQFYLNGTVEQISKILTENHTTLKKITHQTIRTMLLQKETTITNNSNE